MPMDFKASDKARRARKGAKAVNLPVAPLVKRDKSGKKPGNLPVAPLRKKK